MLSVFVPIRSRRNLYMEVFAPWVYLLDGDDHSLLKARRSLVACTSMVMLKYTEIVDSIFCK